MCGIAVIAAGPGAGLEPRRVERALERMRHRGPDASRVVTSADHRAALGLARLAIIDLEGGAQPIASEDGFIHIVVNGELYDHERVRAELEARGHRFRTGSDSEIALHLYEERGLDAVHALRGEFAFVLYDAHLGRLFAARDRFGVKPLHLARRGGQLWLASEAKGLFAMGLPARWDMRSLWQVACAQYPLPEDSLFDGVQQLPPGHLLTFDTRSGRLHQRPWWQPRIPAEPIPAPQDEAALTKRFAEALSEAVRLRLRADVPVGCYLSGGLDSCAVLGIAARHASGPLDAFTLSFEHDAYDELPVAREMAARAGARLHPVRVSQRDLLSAMPAAVAAAEGLVINGHLSAKFLLSQAVQAAGIKAVLVGEGADEIVAGYPHLRRDLLRHHHDTEGLAALSARNAVAAGIFLPEGDALPLDAVRRRLGFAPSYMEAKATLGQRVLTLCRSDVKARFGQHDAYAAVLDALDVHGLLRGRHPVHQSMVLWSRQSLAQYILKLVGDGTEMAHSIEGRVPYLDHHLVELALSLPVDLKIRDGVEKHILREAARPVLTPAVYRRQKHALLAPPLDLDAWTRELLLDTFTSARFQQNPLFDPTLLVERVEGAVDASLAERRAWDPVLMMALSVAFLEVELGISA